MNYFIYIMIFYAISYCIVYAAGPFNMFTKYREFAQNYYPSNLGDSVDCMFCTPFQLGLLFSIFNYFTGSNCDVPSMYFGFPNETWFVVINMLFDGAFTAACVYLIDTLQTYFENNTKKDE